MLVRILGLYAVEACVDRAEGVANNRAENHQGCDNNDGNQNKDQRIFDQPLASLFRCKQHRQFSFLPVLARQKYTIIIGTLLQEIQVLVLAFM